MRLFAIRNLKITSIVTFHLHEVDCPIASLSIAKFSSTDTIFCHEFDSVDVELGSISWEKDDERKKEV